MKRPAIHLADACLAPLRQCGPQICVAVQFHQLFRQVIGIFRCKVQGRVATDLSVNRYVGRNNGYPGGHAFDQRKTECFGERGGNQNIMVLEFGIDVLMRDMVQCYEITVLGRAHLFQVVWPG